MLSLHEINERNKAFWEQQNALTRKRVEDPLLVRILNRELHSLFYRFVPEARKSVDQILEDAEETIKLALAHHEPLIRRDALSKQASRAGRSKKPDSLQQLIIEIVKNNPNITTPQLFEKLKARPWPESVVEEIDDKRIDFRDRRGSREFLNAAPISGLKDRLSRAKKLLHSR